MSTGLRSPIYDHISPIQLGCSPTVLKMKSPAVISITVWTMQELWFLAGRRHATISSKTTWSLENRNTTECRSTCRRIHDGEDSVSREENNQKKSRNSKLIWFRGEQEPRMKSSRCCRYCQRIFQPSIYRPQQSVCSQPDSRIVSDSGAVSITAKESQWRRVCRVRAYQPKEVARGASGV